MSALTNSAHRRLAFSARVIAAVGAILTATACSNDAPSTGNTASTLGISSGTGQSGTVATALTAPLAVIVQDEGDNPIAGVTVTFVATGGATLGSSTAVTNSSGVAQTTLTLGTVAGSDTVTASANGITTSVQFIAIAGAGPAATIAIVSGSNQTATHGTALASPLVVVVHDQYGNIVPNATVTWATNAGLLGSPSTISDGTGKAQTTWTLPAVVSNDTTTATLSGTSSTAIFAAVAN